MKKILREAIPAFFLLTLLLVLYEDRIRIRPHVIELAFIAYFLPIWFSHWKDLKKRGIIFILFISLLWANLHAGQSLLIIFSFWTITLGELLKFIFYERKNSIYLKKSLILSILITFFLLPVPGVIYTIFHSHKIYKESFVLIPEWHPPVSYLWKEFAGETTPHHLICALFPYLISIIFVIYLTISIVKRNLRWDELEKFLLIFLFIILSLKSARFVYLSIIPAIFLIKSLKEKVKVKEIYFKVLNANFIFLGLLLLIVSYHYNILFQRGTLKNAIKTMSLNHEPGEFPEKASNFLKDAGIEGKIFHYAKWGGYLLYRLFPSCTVFTDGRTNFTMEEKEYLVKTHKLYEREETLKKAFNRFKFQILIFPPPIFPLLMWDKELWILIYRGDDAEVFLTKTSENSENIEKIKKYYILKGFGFQNLEELQEKIVSDYGRKFLEKPHIKKKIEENLKKTNSSNPAILKEGSFNIAMLLFAGGFYKDAKIYLEKIIEYGFEDSMTILYLVWTNLILNEFEEGKKLLLRLEPQKLRAPERKIFELIRKKLTHF